MALPRPPLLSWFIVVGRAHLGDGAWCEVGTASGHALDELSPGGLDHATPFSVAWDGTTWRLPKYKLMVVCVELA